MNPAPRRAALAALLLFPFAAQAAPADAPALRLAMKFTPGTASRYRTTARISNRLMIPGQSAPAMTTVMEVDMVQQQKTVRARSGGGGDIETVTLSGSVRLNGNEMGDPAAARPVTTVYDARGNVVAVKGLEQASGGKQVFGGGVLGAGFLNMQRLYLPGKPVKPGDVWTQPATMPGLPIAGKGSVTARYLRDEKYGRHQTARIRADLTMPMKVLFDAAGLPTDSPKRAVSVLTGTLKMTFTSNFAPAEGLLVRTAGSGGVTLALQPRKATNRKPVAGALPANMRVPMTLEVGNALIE